tara:strand:+ start:298 stop:558 length:261 start_codon:yes stop_codon:yes gene_type:complete
VGIFNPVKRFRGDIQEVPTIKEIKELIRNARILNLSKKYKENYRPVPKPALSPFVLGYPIVKQDWRHEGIDETKKDNLKEIRKAGL